MTTISDPGEPAPGTERRPNPIAVLSRHDMEANPHACSAAIEAAEREGYRVFSWLVDPATNEQRLYADLFQGPEQQPEESFAAEPLTPGERRAEKSTTANSWAPRDLLVKMLREHDAGTAVLDEIVIVWLSGDEFGFWNASKKTTTALGLLSAASHDIAEQSSIK